MAPNPPNPRSAPGNPWRSSIPRFAASPKNDGADEAGARTWRLRRGKIFLVEPARARETR